MPRGWNRSQRLLWGVAAVALIAVVLANRSSLAQKAGPDEPLQLAQAKGPDDATLREFMRQKLDASNQILEGLCTEDMALVKAGADKLGELSEAERWRVSTDAMYKQFSTDFREITLALSRAAEGDNPDRVALKWMDATMSCLDCHRFVRGMRLAGGN